MRLVNGRFLGWVFLLAIFNLGMSAAKAQTNYGAVRGLAKDVQGAVIPDAEVTLTNVGTKIVRTSKTNGAGEYLFTAVDPGDYEITVILRGFKTFKDKMTVDLGITTTADASLQVGSTGETIEVTSTSAELVDTSSANRGELYSEKELQDLPQLGRNPFILEMLDTNVVQTGDPRYVRAEDQSGSSAVSVGGAPTGANNYVVDGIPVATSSGGVTFIPSPEAVSDEKVQVNTYDAEVGRAGGGVFNTSLKSGTKTYHGVLYGDTRQTAWAANSWHDKNTPLTLNGVTTPQTPRPDNTTYLYAGAFGGPLPFSEKSRYTKNTFFWITEEGYRQAQPLTGSGNLVVPTAAELTGDFTADFGGGSTTAAIVPITSTNKGVGATILYDPTSPFVGGKRTGALMGIKNGVPTQNVVPASYMNPLGVWIASNAYPSPTYAPPVSGTTGAAYGTPNSQRTDDFKTRSDMYSGKLDHVFFPWWTSNVSYVHLATQEPSGDFYGNKAYFSGDGKLVRFNDATSFGNVFTVNATTLVTVSYGFNRYFSVTYPYSYGFNLTNGFGGLGLPASFVSTVQSPTFPSISVSGAGESTLGASFGGRSIPAASHNFVTGFVKTVGKQNLKGGYVYRALHIATTPTGGNASFGFTGAYTSISGQGTSLAAVSSAGVVSGSGSGLADLLMGQAATAGTGETFAVFNERASYHALYFQDDFRLTEKFTVNLGLRYEYELGEREANNQLAVGFDRNFSYQAPSVACGTSTCGGALLRGGLELAGQNGYPVHVANQSHTKFSPRIGVAYQLRKGTVIRGGVGVFYSPVGLTAYTPGYSQSSSYTVNGTGALTAPLSASQLGPTAPTALTNPFNGVASSAGGTGILIPPSGNSLGNLTGLLAGSISVVDPNRRDPLVEQYSVDLQHELPWGTSVKLAYSGAHSKNDPLSVNLNQLPVSQLAAFAAAAAAGNGTNFNNSTCTNGCTANPYYVPTISNGTTSYSTGSLTNSTTITQAQLLLPYPQYSSVTLAGSGGYSLYNAFSVKVQKRATKGLTVLLGYTWASNWDNISGTLQDNYNLKGNYSRSSNDTPNRFTASVTYQVPIGRGKALFGGMPKYLDYLVGGYEISSISQLQNGLPFAVTQGTNYSSTFGTANFTGTVRPNMVPGVNPCYSGRPQSRSGLNGSAPYFNPAAFSAAPAFTFGNEPAELACKGPGLSRTDFAAYKTFSIGERVKIQFRATAQNATNTPQFTAAHALSTAIPSTQASGVPYYGVPLLTLTANSTGLISQSNFNRLIQLGGRVTF